MATLPSLPLPKPQSCGARWQQDLAARLAVSGTQTGGAAQAGPSVDFLKLDSAEDLSEIWRCYLLLLRHYKASWMVRQAEKLCSLHVGQDAALSVLALNHLLALEPCSWRWRAVSEQPQMEHGLTQWSEVEEALFLHYTGNWFHTLSDTGRLVDGQSWNGKEYWKWIGLGRGDLASRLMHLSVASALPESEASALASFVAALGGLRVGGCLLLALLPRWPTLAALANRLFLQTELCAVPVTGGHKVFLVGLHFQGLEPVLLQALNTTVSKELAQPEAKDVGRLLDDWAKEAEASLGGEFTQWSSRLPADWQIERTLPVEDLPFAKHLLWGRCRESLLRELPAGEGGSRRTGLADERAAKRAKWSAEPSWWRLDRSRADHRSLAQSLEMSPMMAKQMADRWWKVIRLPSADQFRRSIVADATLLPALLSHGHHAGDQQPRLPEGLPDSLLSLVQLLQVWLPERLVDEGDSSLSYQRCLCLAPETASWLQQMGVSAGTCQIPKEPGQAQVAEGQANLVFLELAPPSHKLAEWEFKSSWRQDFVGAVSMALGALGAGADLVLWLPSVFTRFTVTVVALLAVSFSRFVAAHPGVAIAGSWLIFNSYQPASVAGPASRALLGALWSRLAELGENFSISQVLPGTLFPDGAGGLRRHLTDFNNALMAAELNGRAKRTLSDAGLLRQLTEMRIKHYLYVGAKHRALVGLYFGTFDPLHENHFRLVLCALRTCGLRRVVLVPNQGSNPYKQGCTPMSERVACIKERIRIAEEAGELEPGEVIVRKEAGANNWPQREKVAQAVEREEFADATVTANVVLLLGEDSFSKSLSQATGKHKNVGIFQLQSRPRRLIVFPRAQQELVIPEKLRDYVQVAPYKDLVEGLSSSKIRALVETGAEAPDAQAVHPAVWARLKEYVKSAASEGSADALGTRSSGEDEEESFVPHSDQGNCWADPAAHYDAQAPSSSSLRDRPQSPTVRLRNFNSFAKAVLLDQFLTDVLRQAGGEGRPLSVLDLGCGKGGDLKKLMNSGLTHYCGLDVSYASLEVFRARLKDLQSNRAPRHGLLGRSEGLALKEVALIHADAFRECLESTWDRRRYGTARSQLGRSWFHLVTSQMACHYAFQSQESLETMLDNVSKRLCSGGYFVATVPDAKRIVSAQRNALSLGRAFGRLGNNLFGIEFSEEEWSKVESITWDETSDQLDKRAFGIMYRFDLVDAVDSCLEPLVHFPSLRAIAKSKGLQLSLAPTPLSQLVMGDKAELGRLRRIYAFAGGMALHSNEAREQREAMEFYVAFAFQKEQAEDLPTCQEVSEGLTQSGCTSGPGEILNSNSDCMGSVHAKRTKIMPMIFSGKQSH